MQGTHGTADDGAKRLIQMDEPPMHAHAQVQHLVLGDAPKGIHTAFVGEIDPVAFALEIGNAFLEVVDEMENTRDFHFPLRIRAKISEYAPILTFQIALSFQVNFHLALRQQRKKFQIFINSPQTLNLLIKLKFRKKNLKFLILKNFAKTTSFFSL